MTSQIHNVWADAPFKPGEGSSRGEVLCAMVMLVLFVAAVLRYRISSKESTDG